MIKKLQIKFVSITMSILLAVFIAVLLSINLIMQSMMKSQSRVVLNQIATSINYDENTSTFSFKVTGNAEEVADQPADLRNDIPPSPPSEKKNAPQPDNQQSAVTEQQTTQQQTDSAQPVQSDTAPSSEAHTEYSAPPTEAYSEENNTPAASEPQTTMPATQPHTEYTAPTTTALQPAEPPSEHNRKTEDEEQGWIPWDSGQTDTQDYNYNPWENPWFWMYNPYAYNYDPYSFQFGYPQINDNFSKYYDYTPENAHNDHDIPNTDEQPQTEPVATEQTEGTEQLGYSNGAKLLDGYSVINPQPAEVVIMKKNNEVKAAPTRDAAAIDYFVLMADRSGKLVDTLYGSDINSSLAQKYISSILKDGAKTGMIDTFQFYRMDKNNGTVLVFTDKTSELDMLGQLTKTTVLIGCISLLFIAGLVIFLSKVSIAPVKKAFDKQKQFVSDASHELKTPLTIISTNADVLSGEIGDNRWLSYIKSQTGRMSLLVNDLLNLTRIENNSGDVTFTEFDLSHAILNTALPFECQAFEANKKFELDIQEGLTLNASERHIKQMAAIFIDNAIKHSGPNGEIKISLVRLGDKKVLSVYNTGSSIPESEREKIFERFYRSDASRARSTGGYGLGLAIAKSIIDMHKFKVNIAGADGESVCFSVIM